MRTGDVVKHGPSGEEWIVAWADHESGDMAPCGWPTCQARISDCTVTMAASDTAHAYWAAQVRSSGRTDAHRAPLIAQDKGAE